MSRRRPKRRAIKYAQAGCFHPDCQPETSFSDDDGKLLGEDEMTNENAMRVARQHADETGHETWVSLTYRYYPKPEDDNE